MIADYFFNDGPGSPQKKQDTSGSFGFRSSQFSQKNNNSSNKEGKKTDPSFFNESSIQKLNSSSSGEFIYFQNDSVLSELGLELQGKKKSSVKQQQKQKKKKDAFNFSKQISFEDSMQKSVKVDDSQIKEYGTGRSNLPPTLKKPKFGFKVSQTAQSSAIMKDAEPSVVNIHVNEQYQLKKGTQVKNQLKSHHSKQPQPQSQSGQPRLNSKPKNENDRLYYKQDSISSIKRPFQQPSLSSRSLTGSNSLSGSLNFRSVFKPRVQKASAINSSLTKHHKHAKSNRSILSIQQLNNRSLSRNGLMDKEVKITELKDLRELQNKLGELKHQNKKIIEYMIGKDQEIEELKKKKIQIEEEDPYAVMKENQLMKAFLNNNKVKQSPKHSPQQHDYLGYTNNTPKNLHSARSLKQLSMKKSSQISSLHDYDTKQHKFKVHPIPFSKSQKKLILSNRGMIFSQKYLDVGYSLKDNVLTMYLTLKKEFEEMRVRLEKNSFVVSESIDRVFRDVGIGKQMKFKTEIRSTTCGGPEDQHVPMCLEISLTASQRFQNKVNQYKVDLPITVYNIAKHLDLQSSSNTHLQSNSRASSNLPPKQTFKTQTFVGCKQMARNPQTYLTKLFPTGTFLKNENEFHVGLLWKGKQDLLRIRIKQRSLVVEGEGDPNVKTFQVLRSVVGLLVEEKKEIQEE